MNQKLDLKTQANQPLAYSYVRFSRPEQEKGDSIRRQKDLSKSYAERMGLTLVSYVCDEGVSGFHGKNFAIGALGQFYKDVIAKKVPEGSYLLVESLDRLSRQEVLGALRQLMAIVDAGIVIVTLSDGERVYKRDTIDTTALIVAITVMSRANEESETKRKRLLNAWKSKRERASAEKLTKRAPAWLVMSADRKSFEINEERAAIVKKIFQMAADGNGNFSICREMNEAKIPAFVGKNGWHQSTIQKLLTNRAVIGEFQPHIKEAIETGSYRKVSRKPLGEPITDYYPAILSYGQFFKVTALRKERQTKPGRIGDNVSNLFSHICKCGNCGSTVSYSNKGKWRYLVCEAARRKHQCPYASWAYADFESTFLRIVGALDVSQILGNKDNTVIDSLYAKLAIIESRILATEEAIKNIMAVIENGSAPSTIVKRLEELESEGNRLKNEEKETNEKISSEKNRIAGLSNSEEWKKVLSANKSDPSFRLRLREEIRAKIASIKIFPKEKMSKAAEDLVRFKIDDESLKRIRESRHMQITFHNSVILIIGREEEDKAFQFWFRDYSHEPESWPDVDWRTDAPENLKVERQVAK